MFQHLPTHPGDPILALYVQYLEDSRPHKVNLGIGMYFDGQGQLPVPGIVLQAERRLAERAEPRPYLPMEGLPAFRHAVQHLLFGARHCAVEQGRVATVQTVGSCGGLRLGADFLRTAFPSTQVWISAPSWDNHQSLFAAAGLAVGRYPYLDAGRNALDFDALCAHLDRLPARSVVLLHGCCHNPTGADPSSTQWRHLIAVLARRHLIPFVDLAYQGYGEGLDGDVAPLRAMADAGLCVLVANSFSKNMGLYGERCGALSVVCPDAAQAALVLGQLQAHVRQNYSSPPRHAGLLVAQILGDPALRAQWEQEVAQMRERMVAMRRALHAALAQRMPERDFDFVLRQRGMFSLMGLTAPQVDTLREQHAIYLVRSGRLCVAGLTSANVDPVAHALAAVLRG